MRSAQVSIIVPDVQDLIAIEMQVATRLAKLLADASELRSFCERSGVATPPAVLRLAGDFPTGGARQRPAATMTISFPPRPDPPPGASESWIWIPEVDAAVVSLVLAILHRATQPLTPTQIFDLLPQSRQANRGSINNLGTKLEKEGTISRNDEGGWTMTRPDRAPIAHGGHLWGPPSVFEKGDLTAHRRAVVKHILRSSPDGLQVMQLTKLLAEACPWFNKDIPASKDLLKLDIKELEQQRAVRRKGGATGKWELVE